MRESTKANLMKNIVVTLLAAGAAWWAHDALPLSWSRFVLPATFFLWLYIILS